MNRSPIRLTGWLGIALLGLGLYHSAKEWKQVKSAPREFESAEQLVSEGKCRNALPVLEELYEDVPGSLRVLELTLDCQEQLGLSRGAKETTSQITAAREAYKTIGQASKFIFSYYFYSSWYDLDRWGTHSRSRRNL